MANLPFRITRSNFFGLTRFLVGMTVRGLIDRVRGVAPREERALEYVRSHATAGDPDSVLAAFDTFGRRHAFLMNVGDRKGLILDAEVRGHASGRLLEIGCYCGYSAVRIGRLLAPAGGQLISIEASADYAAVARQVIELAGLSKTVEIRVGTAEDVLPSLQGPFDLVFIDHWKDLYLPDLQRVEALGLLRAGSAVVADNVGLFDASAYLDHVRSSGLYDSVGHVSSVEYRDYVPDAVEVSTWKG